MRWATPQLWLVLAMAGVAALYLDHALKASMVIDGARWFWLDDDQMISMRYARNLVEGHGLVWNPGERVEGYTNFGWTLLMAGVHMLPLPDRLMPFAMTVLSGLICLAATVAGARLLMRLEPRGLTLTLPALLVCLLTCTDVMLWATSGFETVLVTALHLSVVLQVIRCEDPGAKLLLPLALIPIVRSDGMHVWLGDALLVFWLAPDRKRAALLLLATLLPFAGHLAFRLAYYGEWLPNTYYLKVSGLDARWSRGLDYVLGFIQRYSIVLIFAICTAAAGLLRRDWRALSLATSLVPPLFYSASVGGDDFQPFRFFAHVMPELFVWAVLGAATLMTALLARTAWLLALLVFVLPPFSQIAPAGNNGEPSVQIVVAAELRKNASPDASVAVIAAGIVPYFTRLRGVDLLGKSDAYIARLPPAEGALVGHGKLDPAYSLAKNPDYVVSYRPHEYVQYLAIMPSADRPDYVKTVLSSKPLREHWLGNPVPNAFLLERSAVYVRDGSPELAKLKTWAGVNLGR